MPYCENCGSQINPNAKFCASCGTARTQPTQTQPSTSPQPAPPKRERLSYYSPPPANAYVPPPPMPLMGTQTTAYPQPAMQQPYIPQTQPAPQQAAPAPMPQQQASGEAAVGVIVLKRMKSLGRWDTYTGVVTTHRLIFAQMTSQMLTDAAQQSREQAKAEGKGFWGQWADQLRATFGYAQRYMTMAPQAILAETPGNFALDNNAISEVKVKLRHINKSQAHEFEVEFHTMQGTFEYHIEENSAFTDLLKRVYGERVKMPFGYFSKSINIKI